MQIFYSSTGDRIVERIVPAPELTVLPGVPWGRQDVLFTPAYWLTQYWMREHDYRGACHRLGRTLREEVVACLLGGHGIPAEVGVAAFCRLRDQGLIDHAYPNPDLFLNALRQPFILNGRTVRYRFWKQKARYLAAVLGSLRDEPLPLERPRCLRDYLMHLPGIGPKTASWIVRNWLGSNEVAILDIHIVRAGRLMGLYSNADRVEQHYVKMERRFLDLAQAMEVPAAHLDALIWDQMRRSGDLVASLLGLSKERSAAPMQSGRGRRLANNPHPVTADTFQARAGLVS